MCSYKIVTGQDVSISVINVYSMTILTVQMENINSPGQETTLTSNYNTASS